MPEDFSYEVALRAALSIVHTLSAAPGMPRQQTLAIVTDAVLGAIRRVEEAQPPAPLAEGTARVWLPLPGGDPDILYLSESNSLPPANSPEIPEPSPFCPSGVAATIGGVDVFGGIARIQAVLARAVSWMAMRLIREMAPPLPSLVLDEPAQSD